MRITSPASGTTLSSRNITLTAEASDNVGVVAVQFLVDGSPIANATAAPYRASWNLRRAARGTHTVSVRAVDASGNATQQSVTVTVK